MKSKSLISYLLFLLAILFMGFTSFAQQNNGKIKGKITTSDGEPAVGVNVILKNSKYGTIANEDGSFEFNKVKANSYTLEVSLTGYETIEKEVTVTNSETTNINLQLNVSNEQLQEVVINNGKANKFATTSSIDVSKMPLKNLENPQIYNVINGALMKEQITTSYQQALNNIPGAMATTVGGGNGGTYVQMRGFYTTGGFRDGIPVIQYASSDPVNIEKIEAIKGPTGTLFGSLASYGGIINRVTKKPYETFGGEISYSAGSYNLNRLTVDVNTPLNKEKTILFRLNGSLHNEDSFQDFGYKHNYAIAPSFTYKASEKLMFSLSTEIYQSKWIGTYYNYSFPTAMTNLKDSPVGYEQSLIGDELESVTRTFNNYIKAEYQFLPNWKSITTYTTMQNNWQPLYSYGLDWNSTDNNYTRYVSKAERGTFNTLDIQQNFNGAFNIGNFKNRVLVGFDYYNYKGSFKNDGSVTYDVISLPSDDISPISKQKFESLFSDLPNNKSTNGQTIISAYASDVINISKKFITMLSIRADRFLNSTPISNGVEYKENDYNQTSFSPKLGLVYQPIQDVISLFASYSNGFSNVAPVTQKDGTVSIFKPEHANQIEGGIKANAFNKKLSGSLSYFNILVDNKVRLNEVGFSIQDGSQRNSGVELDFQANPIKGFNIMVGYTYLDAKFLKIDAGNEGLIPGTSPKNLANFWASYQLNNGLGLGLGGNYSDKSLSYSNTFIIPSSTILNSSIFYDYKKIRLGLKVNNIGNVKSWDINYYPQALRQFVGNITFKF